MGNEQAPVFADAELAAVMADPAGTPPPARTVGVSGARAASRERAASRPSGPEIAVVKDFTVDGEAPIPVRLYRPSLDALPVVVFLHGGGWTVGDLDSHDRVCRRFALAGVVVLSVDYRLAPEHPWPAAIDDSIAVTRWALEHVADLGGTSAVSIAGDSAGGNLAALVALACRASLTAQILVYPQTDLTFSQPSHIEKGEGFGLTSDSARFFAEQWVPDRSMRGRADVSPMFATDFTGVAPALVVVADHDPLRDEGAEYARRLAAGGVPTTFRNELGLIHGFLSYDSLSPAAKAAGDRIFSEGAVLASGRPLPE